LARHRTKKNQMYGNAGLLNHKWFNKPVFPLITIRKSRPVSRVLSRTIIPLGSPSPANSSGLPGSTRGHALPLAWRLPYLALLQVGFAVPPNVATGAVRSYRTVSPLPASLLKLRRFIFCCTFRRLTPPRRYLAPRPQGARTFLHISREMQRPSGRLRAHHIDMFPTSQVVSCKARFTRPARLSRARAHAHRRRCASPP
jgi:hypothetical protein